MQLNLEDVITNPEWIGKIVYVCAFQPGRHASRALQNITATAVLVESRERYFELSTKKKDVYYCTNILLTYNERQSKINYNKPISPYDNTSFKSRKNGPLSVFDNLKECQEHYIKLIK